MEEIPRPLFRRRADSRAGFRLPGTEEQRARHGIRGTGQPGILRELHRVDYRLVFGDPPAARAGAGGGGGKRFRQTVFQRICRGLRSERHQPFGFLPAAACEHAGFRQDIRRSGFSAILAAGAESGGRGRYREIASVSGGVYTERGHQLESRQRRDSGVDRHSDVLFAAGESDRLRMEAGDALDLLRPGRFPDLQPG